jgi:hypothetical protein
MDMCDGLNMPGKGSVQKKNVGEGFDMLRNKNS